MAETRAPRGGESRKRDRAGSRTDRGAAGGRTPGPSTEQARLTREVTARAIRRLSIIEAMIMVGMVAFTLLGGAIGAFLLQMSFGWAFRPTWIGTSVALFVGAVLIVRIRDRLGSAD